MPNVREVRDWYQLNSSLILVNIQPSGGKPYLGVGVAVPNKVGGKTITFSGGMPQAPDGFALHWKTTVDYHGDATFGDDDTGSWELVADNTQTTLYETSDGTEYTPASDKEYDGYGPVPDWLTTEPRPSTLHNWVDGAWYADPAAVAAAAAAKTLADAQAKIASETARATTIIDTIQPAVTGGYAEAGDADVLAAWKQYRYLLSKVPAQSGYPATITWPAAPDAESVEAA